MSESDTHLRNKALRHMKNVIAACNLPDTTKICFVLSYPRSDMGKGTLVAQLLANLPNADVIKFDGLLNTNASGRHTTPGHDDFGTYERFNPGRTWGKENYILGGELYKRFIDTYGESENLRIKQHLSLYLEMTLCNMWVSIGRPDVLFVEVGGVLSDAEVDPLFTPMIQKMQRANPHTEVLLLTESGHNGEYIKTKTIQDGIAMLTSRGITPTIIAAREPEALQDMSEFERIECERTIINRIEDNLGRAFYRIVSIPHYSHDRLPEYTAFVKKRLLPFMYSPETNNKVVIGTSNEAKYKDFKLYLQDTFEVIKAPRDSKIDIPEGMHSLEENAIAKARTWCILTGLPAIADDTGFFINALHGEPGVATRRWGGELSETATNADFWSKLQAKVLPLDDTSAYVEQCVAIVKPNGSVRVVRNRTNGYIDKNKLAQSYNNTGYPLAAAFVATERTKAWDEMNDDERKTFDRAFIDELVAALSA